MDRGPGPWERLAVLAVLALVSWGLFLLVLGTLYWLASLVAR